MGSLVVAANHADRLRLDILLHLANNGDGGVGGVQVARMDTQR